MPPVNAGADAPQPAHDDFLNNDDFTNPLADDDAPPPYEDDFLHNDDFSNPRPAPRPPVDADPPPPAYHELFPDAPEE